MTVLICAVVALAFFLSDDPFVDEIFDALPEEADR